MEKELVRGTAVLPGTVVPETMELILTAPHLVATRLTPTELILTAPHLVATRLTPTELILTAPHLVAKQYVLISIALKGVAKAKVKLLLLHPFY